MGVGVLIINANENLDTLIEGGTGINSRSAYQDDSLPEKFESGTQNVPGILGFGASLKFVKNIGLDYIFQHEKKLMLDLFEDICDIKDLKIYTSPKLIKNFPGVFSINFKNKNSENITSVLGKAGIAVRGGLHCAPLAHEFLGTLSCGAVRISPSVFTTKQEIKKLSSILRKIKSKK